MCRPYHDIWFPGRWLCQLLAWWQAGGIGPPREGVVSTCGAVSTCGVMSTFGAVTNDRHCCQLFNLSNFGRRSALLSSFQVGNFGRRSVLSSTCEVGYFGRLLSTFEVVNFWQAPGATIIPVLHHSRQLEPLFYMWVLRPQRFKTRFVPG